MMRPICWSNTYGFVAEDIDALKASIIEQLASMDDCVTDDVYGDFNGESFGVTVEAYSKESELEYMMDIEYEIMLDGKIYTDENKEELPYGNYEIIEAHFDQGKAFAKITRIVQ